jgi:hypothetical protein
MGEHHAEMRQDSEGKKPECERVARTQQLAPDGPNAEQGCQRTDSREDGSPDADAGWMQRQQGRVKRRPEGEVRAKGAGRPQAFRRGQVFQRVRGGAVAQVQRCDEHRQRRQ